jgi:AAA+ superfamily predicted ATPase
MKVDEVKEVTIEDFFTMCEDEKGRYQIDTPDGWQDINFLVRKKNKECYNLVLEDGIDLGCSESHQVLTQNGWKKSVDINVQKDSVITKDGSKSIVAKECIGIRNTFDLNVNSEQHRYYSNGVISHNCGKSLICKAISNVWGMPLLRLDFGRLFGSLVGDSEKNVRSAIKIAESVAPCVIGETFVTVNGDREKIENVFNTKEKEKENEISVFYDDNNEENQKIVSLSKDTSIKSVKNEEIVEIKLKAIVRTKKKEKMIVLKTQLGKEIVATKDHLLMDDSKKMKKIKDFKEADKISIVYRDNTQGDVMQIDTEIQIVEDKVVSVEEIDFEGYVYDACCEDPHLYMTNDFISHNCILWIDEIEKAISGVSSSGNTDGGTTSRVLSTFLTWMQEKESPVFVIATANDHESIPAEFLRAGRFDEIFFVDLPNIDEREEIFDKLLKMRKINVKNIDTSLLARISQNYSGAEIEKAIDNAMLIGFSEKCRKITTDDILLVMKDVKTLFKMREGEFENLKEWAEKQCRSASKEPVKKIKIGENTSFENLDV